MKIKRCTMIALVLLMIISNVYAEPTATPIPTTDPTATTDPIVTSDPTITLNPTATSDPTITSDPSASPDTTETPKPTAEIAEYIIEFRSYDENTKVYTADVYLDTKECLSAGTFGMQYDASIMPKFELDPMFMEHLNFPNNGQNYLVFQWGVSPQTEEPDPGVTPDPEATADPDATWEPEATLKPTEEPDPDATPEPTAIPGSIVTPGPTARPGPTWTPGPTARPGPTLTPGPTARPDPTLTPGPTARPEPTSDENTIWSSDVKKVMTGKLHFGTITIENVELNTSGKPLNWHDKTLRQLNWYITPESKEDMYTFTDGITCLNDEIYNKETGFYQGWDVAEGFYNPDWDGEPRWVDIGFVWNSGYDLPTKTNKSISVFVNSYNPKNSVEFKLYDKDNKEAQIENVIPTEMADPATGKVKGSYELEVNVPDGAYTLEIKKDVHLTYKMEVTVSEEERAAQSVTLYCGDISGDEKIKLNDRTALLNRLNKQNAVNPDRCDLNGDGKVTQFDLSIMKLYYNKSY